MLEDSYSYKDTIYMKMYITVEPLYNEVLSVTNFFFKVIWKRTLIKVKEPHYNEHILPVPFPFRYIQVPLYFIYSFIVQKVGGGGGGGAGKYFIQAIIVNSVDSLGLEDMADDLSCLFLLLKNLSSVTKQLLIVLIF